jgi:hypothetical protein
LSPEIHPELVAMVRKLDKFSDKWEAIGTDKVASYLLTNYDWPHQEQFPNYVGYKFKDTQTMDMFGDDYQTISD